MIQIAPRLSARTQIQLAIDLVAKQGGTVQLPPGTFTLDCALDLKSNVHLKGCGQGVTVLKIMNDQKVSASEAWAFKKAAIRIKGCRNAKVSDLTLNGNKANNLSYFHFDDTYPGGAGQVGIAVCHDFSDKNAGNEEVYSHVSDKTRWSRNCEISNCEIFDFVEDGIHILGSENIVVRDCMCMGNSGFTKNDPKALDSSFGIILEQHTEHCLIEGCTTFNNHHGGIECYHYTSRLHTIRNCTADVISVNLNFDFGVENGKSKLDPAFVKTPELSEVYHTIEGCTLREDMLPTLTRGDGKAPPLLNLVHGSFITVRNCTFFCYNKGMDGINRQDEVSHLGDRYNLRGLQVINNRFHLLPSKRYPDFSHSNYPAIRFFCLNDFVFSDNTFHCYNVGSAIDLSNCANGLVTGNVFVGGSLGWEEEHISPHSSIHLKRCVSIDIQANTFRGFISKVLNE